MKLGPSKWGECRRSAVHISSPLLHGLILKLKGHEFHLVLVNNTQLLQPLITIQYELISTLCLRTKKYWGLELQKLGQHIMLIIGHHRTQQRMEESIITYPSN